MEQKYVMAAIDAALKAGENILSIYDDPASDFEIERKADNSPLTIADRKAHEAFPKPLSAKRLVVFFISKNLREGEILLLFFCLKYIVIHGR